MKASILHSKFIEVMANATLDNASGTTPVIDTLGYEHLFVLVRLNTTDIALTALKLQQSDSDSSGFVDITGHVYGATGAPALPSATDDNKFYGFFVDLRGKKRYIDLVVTAGDGSVGAVVYAVGALSQGEVAQYDADSRGLAAYTAA